ncbi:MAG: YggS family pyridoxal phosphate-dependent enzyme [Gammaproteobacteria bacterium]|nr:YggS family pyridoxal phosphate-dependent enzyme [Gammaproteobacteria bacterium]
MILPSKHLKKVLQRIQQATKQANRETEDIRLIAVSKTKPAADVEQVYLAGQREFGENYLQEALDKIAALHHLTDIKWHFIGAIQSNKTRPIAEHFDWVHSVDRLKIARRLAEQRPPELPPLNICLQVNLSNEDSKSGVSITEVPALAKQVSQLKHLSLRGLMAIPLKTDDPAQQHFYFHQLKHCLDELNSQGMQLDTLSMGMSNDMEVAIAEGATMIRIGTAIFGERSAK